MKINPIGHLVKTNPIQTQTNPILSAVGGLQMNLTFYLEIDYENISNWTLGENKPKQTQSRPDFFIDSIARRVYNCVVALLVIW
jgi:hypothetical protein